MTVLIIKKQNKVRRSNVHSISDYRTNGAINHVCMSALMVTGLRPRLVS